MNSRVLADTSFPGLRLTGLGHLGLFLLVTASLIINLSGLGDLAGEESHLLAKIKITFTAQPLGHSCDRENVIRSPPGKRVLNWTSAPRDKERVSMNIIDEDALEELKKELTRPRAGPPERVERKRLGKRKDTGEGFHALPCADMTCPCRIIRKEDASEHAYRERVSRTVGRPRLADRISSMERSKEL